MFDSKRKPHTLLSISAEGKPESQHDAREGRPPRATVLPLAQQPPRPAEPQDPQLRGWRRGQGAAGPEAAACGCPMGRGSHGGGGSCRCRQALQGCPEGRDPAVPGAQHHPPGVHHSGSLQTAPALTLSERGRIAVCGRQDTRPHFFFLISAQRPSWRCVCQVQRSCYF